MPQVRRTRREFGLKLLEPFTVPASGNATINLVTTSAALSGNDFGIDDISFQYTCESYDTVWIAPKSDAQILIDTTALFACDSLCFTLDNALDSLGLLSYQWVLSDGTIDSTSILYSLFGGFG
jgi:hypothetical protein